MRFTQVLAIAILGLASSSSSAALPADPSANQDGSADAIEVRGLSSKCNPKKSDSCNSIFLRCNKQGRCEPNKWTWTPWDPTRRSDNQVEEVRDSGDADISVRSTS
uniref:Uncharacterized protein n=1 Tax=Bionectria ochroleuca TaxID=29856 RepID=A0A8H7NI71_BIOOC